MPPDPKRKGKRVVDSDAVFAKLLLEPWCRVCRKPAGSGHHIAGRRLLDDRPEVVVPLCGSGTTGCHGLIERHDEATSRKLGSRLRIEEIAAVLHDVGALAGRAYLCRRYYIDPDDLRFAA